MHSSSGPFIFLLLAVAAFHTSVHGAAVSVPEIRSASQQLVAQVRSFDDLSIGVSDAAIQEKPELFEGDIAGVDIAHLIKTHQVKHINPKNGVVGGNLRWYGGAIYYAISSAFSASERALIVKAIGEFSKTAAVGFYARTTERDYINIMRGARNSGCWAYIGRTGGAQQLNLEPSFGNNAHCMHHSIIVHEINHAVGFYHEQSRTDRDQYIEINWNNIHSGQRFNFDAHGASVITHFSQPYDFGSLMHYEWNAFAINPNIWTIRGRGGNQNVKLGNFVGLTPTDIKKIDAMYPLCGRLYTDENQKGTYVVFTKGVEYGAFGSGIQNAMSSAYVVPGCKMTVCKGGSMSGSCVVLESSGSGNYWNSFASFQFDNVANSAKCTC